MKSWRNMRNLRLDICYDGTRYRGWQRLAGEPATVQGKIEQVLSRVLQEDIQISGSGRTDAGAHALGQVANFHCQSSMPEEEILAALRRYLPEDIGIYSCRQVSPRFHARLNARDKTYVYRIWNSDMPCVFQRRFVYPFPEPLNVAAMNRAAAHFLGEHDFSAFCTKSGKDKSTLRRIDLAQVRSEGNEIRIIFRGNGFLYNMVRIMTGTLLEVGLGLRDPDSIPDLFGKPRRQAGRLVPPGGLCLMEVSY